MSEITVPDDAELLKKGLRLISPQQLNVSAWTGNAKTIGQPGIEMWSGMVSLEQIATESEERQWRAFLFALGGPENWFRWMLPCQTHDGSKPMVGSGASNGYTLPLSGLAVSSTILAAGQFMTVPLPSGKYRTVCLTSPLVSDGSGLATASFRPALPETPTSGVTVETLDPFIPMRPVGDTLGLDTDQGLSGTAFDVREYR